MTDQAPIFFPRLGYCFYRIIGERMPKSGEWFISRAAGDAIRATFDHQTFDTAKIVVVPTFTARAVGRWIADKPVISEEHAEAAKVNNLRQSLGNAWIAAREECSTLPQFLADQGFLIVPTGGGNTAAEYTTDAGYYWITDSDDGGSVPTRYQEACLVGFYGAFDGELISDHQAETATAAVRAVVNHRATGEWA